MADINIYGRLWNKTTDGEIVSAAQVKDSDYSGGSKFQHAINEELREKIIGLSDGVSVDWSDITGMPSVIDFYSDGTSGSIVTDVVQDTDGIMVRKNTGDTDIEETVISFKTVNGESILGSGDIAAGEGSVASISEDEIDAVCVW